MKKYPQFIVKYNLVKEETNVKTFKATQSRIVYKYILDLYGNNIEIFESMFLFTLNRAGSITGYVLISQGGVSGTVIDIKLIVKYAIESLSDSCILVHNHPSGNMTPSKTDIRITKKAKEALNLLDIRLLDHIIVSKKDYYSFADHGLI